MHLEIKTTRLVLRHWKESDLKPFAQMNADPRVMEYFPSVMSKEESDQLAKRMQAKLEETGYGFLAVSVPNVSEFIGFIGLNNIDKTTWPVHFSPAIEIGWRLATPYWRKGYATEAAQACLKYGFETLGLQEIVSFTAKKNLPSRAVMSKIGMHYDPEGDFDHPKLPNGHRLKKCVLYRIRSRS
ncbi:MAG: GNAT family N-acetyltransferase [Chlamydiota bacterium]